MLEQAVNKTEMKVERWINRGVGVWALAVVLFAVVQFVSKYIGH